MKHFPRFGPVWSLVCSIDTDDKHMVVTKVNKHDHGWDAAIVPNIGTEEVSEIIFVSYKKTSFVSLRVCVILSDKNQQKPTLMLCIYWGVLQRDNMVKFVFYLPDWASANTWICFKDKGLSSLRMCEELSVMKELR